MSANTLACLQRISRRCVGATIPVVLIAVAGSSVVRAAPLDTLQPGQWYEIPNSNMRAVDPCPTRNCSYSAVSGQYGAMEAWSGGAYDSARDRLVIWGGGHQDYAGNEVYVFGPLTSATPTWQRLTQPSSPVQPDVSYYADGNPSSRHTSNTLTYAPNIDKFVVLGGGSFYGSGGYGNRATDMFDFTTNTWSRKATIPGNGGVLATISAYDAVTGHLWHHSTADGGGLSNYDPIANTYTLYPSAYLSYYYTMDVDTAGRKLVALGGGNPVLVWDLNNPGAGPTTPVTSGDKTIENAQAPGFVYDPVSHVFVGWSGGASVYTLNPATWVWSKVSPAASNTVTPTSAEVTGTYGRFRYIPSMNAFIVVNRTTENVFIYKLTSGVSTAPSATLTSNASSVAYQGSLTLTWSSTNTTNCAASDAWSGIKAASGSQTLTGLTASATYTLSCSGAGGSAVRNVSVTVTGAPASSPI